MNTRSSSSSSSSVSASAISPSTSGPSGQSSSSSKRSYGSLNETLETAVADQPTSALPLPTPNKTPMTRSRKKAMTRIETASSSSSSHASAAGVVLTPPNAAITPGINIINPSTSSLTSVIVNPTITQFDTVTSSSSSSSISDQKQAAADAALKKLRMLVSQKRHILKRVPTPPLYQEQNENNNNNIQPRLQPIKPSSSSFIPIPTVSTSTSTPIIRSKIISQNYTAHHLAFFEILSHHVCTQNNWSESHISHIAVELYRGLCCKAFVLSGGYNTDNDSDIILNDVTDLYFPSRIHLVWKEFLSESKEYKKFCKIVDGYVGGFSGGRYIHCNNMERMMEDAEVRDRKVLNIVQVYQNLFGDNPFDDAEKKWCWTLESELNAVGVDDIGVSVEKVVNENAGDSGGGGGGKRIVNVSTRGTQIPLHVPLVKVPRVASANKKSTLSSTSTTRLPLVKPDPPVRIHVKSISDINGKPVWETFTFNLQALVHTTVQDLKNRIQEKVGVSAVEQRLIFKQAVLSDSRMSLDSGGVGNASTIFLVVQSSVGASLDDEGSD
ncbi:hypothetical protein HDU76_002275 [Blyttiomyces sp. JEL0837]|nr:hypothetical protein HDU76_002275 [Blyttiomyces sp. JEL0837]